MKKRGKKANLPEGFKAKPDTIIVYEVHDDGCPFDKGAPCICTPTKGEITVAQFVELGKMGCKSLGEVVGHGKKRH